MTIRSDISRRHVLALSAAAGGLAVSGIRASAQQAAKRIDQLDPALDKIIATSEPIKELASGFGGDLGPAEGPVWIKEGGYLLFSDIHNSSRMKYTPGQGVTRVPGERPTAPTGSPATCRAGCSPASTRRGG